MKKRLIATFLALCLCIGLLPTTALAAPNDEPGSAEAYITLSGETTAGSLSQADITVKVMNSDTGALLGQSTYVMRNYDNDMTISLADSVKEQYDIEDVDGTGSFHTELSSDSFSISAWAGSSAVFTVYLCPEFEEPTIIDPIETWSTLAYRVTESALLKLLHDNGVDVDENTRITKQQAVTLHFVEAYGLNEEWNLNKVPAAANELQYYQGRLSDWADAGNPNNIRYIEIEYEQNGTEYSKKIYSNDLRYINVGNNTYEIESDKNLDEHIVIFYREDHITGGVWSPYDVRFIDHGESVGTLPEPPEYDDYSTYEFVAWTQQHNGGLPVISSTLVNDDMNVFPQYKEPNSDSTLIHVMNNDNLLKERIAELFGVDVDDINWESIKITVHGENGEETNPDYGIDLGIHNGWEDDDGHYKVYNYLTGAGDYENESIYVNDITSISISADRTDGTHFENDAVIEKGPYAGDFSVSTGSYSASWLIELYINSENDYPDNPDPEPEPDPAITGFEKALVASEAEATEAGITGTYDYPDPENDDKVIIPEGESVTLLYAITVEGEAGTTFTVTDEGAELVEVNSVEIEQSGNTFTGTIPTGETSITFYVSKEFTAADIKNDKLTNSASIDSDDGVKEDEEEAEEETPAEPEDLNGTDVTVQVFVDGNSTPVTDPLDYVNLRRVTHDTHKGWHVSGPDPSGMLTCDFDYDAGAANGGYDCVDIQVQVNVKGDTYVLQGVHSYQSYGSGGTDNVIDNGNGTYTIDNVTHAGDDEEQPDVKIYLRTKYTVGYYENGDPSTTVTDDGAYIAGEDIKSTTPDAEEPSKENGSAWVDWKNAELKTSITVKGLPTVAGTVTGWWLNDAECAGETTHGKDATVSVSDAISGLSADDREIKFYAKVEGTGNTATEYWIMNDLGVVEAVFDARAAAANVEAEDFTDIVLGVRNGPYTERGNSENGWGGENNEEYYIVKNGTSGSGNYVPWDQVSQLTFWYSAEGGNLNQLTAITDVDIRVEEPDENGVSRVYLLYDVVYHNIYRNTGSAWDIDERNNWPSGFEYTIPANEKIYNSNSKWYPQDYIDPDNGRAVKFLGWTTTDPNEIYEYNETLPEYLVEGKHFIIDPREENANNQNLYINLYGLWAYKDPFYVEKKLTTVVRNGETLKGNLDGMVLYPGDQLTWTITAYNDSDREITLHLWDVLTAMSGSASLPLTPDLTDADGNPFTNGQTITVPANSTTTLYAYYTVTDKDVGSTLQNTARVSDDPYLDPSNDPFDETENPVANPKLTVTKTADKTTASAGDEITYTVTVTNTGDAPLTDVTVKDDMWAREDNYPIQIDGVDNYVSDNGEFTLKTPIAPNASVTITYTYIVKEADVTAGSIVNRVTVDGGEEGGPGGNEETVWTGKVTIIPADIVIYTGGDGYSGVTTNENGDMLTDPTESGLPEPGYHIELPEAVKEWLKDHGKDTETTAVNLAEILEFAYNHDGETRSWEMTQAGIYDENADTGEVTRYVYTLGAASVGAEEIPVRILYFQDENNNGVCDEGEAKTDDKFEMSELAAHTTYSMTINPGELDQSKIQAVFTVGDESIACYVEIGIGTLTVKSVTDPDNVPTNEIQSSGDAVASGTLTAVAGDNVTYFVNDSEVEVENTNNRVQLLVDSVSNSDAFDGELETDAISEVRADGISLSDARAQSFYLDLVDTLNGNTVVTLGEDDELTIYWPMPDDADPNGDFYIVHYYEMNRENVTGMEDLASAKNRVEEVAVTSDGDHLTFTTGSFSPFVLVYEKDDGGSRPSRPSGGNSGSSSLNTKDHYAYIVGYPDGTVQPQGSITRAEVATIFFRLLTDDAREDNWSQRNSFTDVSEDDWFNNAVSTLTRMGILDGYEDGTFQPNAPITRAEFTKVAVSFFDYAEEDYRRGTFSDVDGSEWYANFIAAAVELGLIEGYGDDTFRPNGDITRAEACTLVNRTLDRAPHEDHLLPRREMNTWSDNPTSAWYYEAIQEATTTTAWSPRTASVWRTGRKSWRTATGPSWSVPGLMPATPPAARSWTDLPLSARTFNADPSAPHSVSANSAGREIPVRRCRSAFFESDCISAERTIIPPKRRRCLCRLQGRSGGSLFRYTEDHFSPFPNKPSGVFCICCQILRILWLSKETAGPGRPAKIAGGETI